MNDNHLLIIAAGLASAVIHFVLQPLWYVFMPRRKALNPLVTVLISFPMGAGLIYAILWIYYLMKFNITP